MTDEKMHGAMDEAKGEVKADVGAAAGDSSTQAEGMMDKIKGEIEELVSDVKEKFGHHDEAPKA